MTRSQIARVLREAAMWAHYNQNAHCPWCAIAEFSGAILNNSVEDFVDSVFGVDTYGDDWTPETIVLALLFAAEAVEGEG